MPELDIQRRPTTVSYWWMWLIGAVLLGLILWWVVIWAAAPSPQRAAVPARTAPAGTAPPAENRPVIGATTGTTATAPSSTSAAAPSRTTTAAPHSSSARAKSQVHERVAGSRQQISAPNAAAAGAGATAGAAAAGSAASTSQAAAQQHAAAANTTASLPIADIHAHPAQFFGKTVSGSARVADVVSERAFWIEEGNNRLLVVAAPSLAQPPALSTGQIVKLQGTVSDPAKAPQSPEWPQLQSDTQQTLQKQPAFIEATSVQLPQT